MLAECLSDLEAGNHTFVVSVFVSYFVWTLGSQPFVSPGFEHKVSIWMGQVVAFLQLSDELSEGSVGPFVFFEVQLEPAGECIPSHQINELLQHTCSLSVGNSIN